MPSDPREATRPASRATAIHLQRRYQGPPLENDWLDHVGLAWHHTLAVVGNFIAHGQSWAMVASVLSIPILVFEIIPIADTWHLDNTDCQYLPPAVLGY